MRHYVNLGIAAATPRGLLVPNIKDAQDLSLRELARALEKLTHHGARGQDARPPTARRHDHDHEHRRRSGWTPAPRSSTPARSGIVALGTIRQKPWVVDGEVRPRWVTTVGAGRSTTASSTATGESASSPTSRRSSRSPRCCSTDDRLVRTHLPECCAGGVAPSSALNFRFTYGLRPADCGWSCEAGSSMHLPTTGHLQ